MMKTCVEHGTPLTGDGRCFWCAVENGEIPEPKGIPNPRLTVESVGEQPPAEPPNEEDAALVELVERFSAALLEKLRASEAKYGWSGGWRHDPNWADDLRRDIRKHI